MQYTLKKYISPMEFYMWEHKILSKEVTPEEFILRILNHPKISEEIKSPGEFINRAYFSLFLSQPREEEVEVWLNKFNKYKEQYFLADENAYLMLIEEMMKVDEFVLRIENLNLDSIEYPVNTRYFEVYENLISDNVIENKISDRFYVLNYDELNKIKVTETTATIFLNETINSTISRNTKFSTDIDGAIVKYLDKKIIIESLKSNTIYEKFCIFYDDKTIFVNYLKIMRGNEQKNSNPSKSVRSYDILNEIGYSMDEFLRTIYKDTSSEIGDDNLIYLRVFFVLGDEKFSEFVKFIYSYASLQIKNLVLVDKMYNFIFNRISDEYGLKFWANEFEKYLKEYSDFRISIRKVIEGMTDSYEFRNRFNNSILNSIIRANDKNKKLRM